MSRPDTAATGTSSTHYPSSDKSFAYSIISSKFQSTGETQVLLLPKVNARRSIKFDKSMSGPKIMAVRETAQWLISSNNRMTDDLSKERQRLDDSYLKWYRKHFNEKKDVLEKVCTLLSTAKKEKTDRDRTRSRSHSYFGASWTPRRHGRSTVQHQRSTSTFFPTEMPDVEAVDSTKENGQGEIPEVVVNGTDEAANTDNKTTQNGLKSKNSGAATKNSGAATKNSGAATKTPVAASKTPPSKNGEKSQTPGAKTPGAKTPGAKTPGAKTPGAKTPGAKTPGVKTRSSATATPAAKSSSSKGKTPAAAQNGDNPDSKKVRIVTPEVQ